MTAMMSSLVSVPEPLSSGAADAAVELHAADGRQVVALLGEEQAVEQRLDRVFGRRLAGTHHPVDRDLARAYWSGVSSVRSVCEMYGPWSRSFV